MSRSCQHGRHRNRRKLRVRNLCAGRGRAVSVFSGGNIPRTRRAGIAARLHRASQRWVASDVPRRFAATGNINTRRVPPPMASLQSAPMARFKSSRPATYYGDRRGLVCDPRRRLHRHPGDQYRHAGRRILRLLGRRCVPVQHRRQHTRQPRLDIGRIRNGDLCRDLGRHQYGAQLRHRYRRRQPRWTERVQQPRRRAVQLRSASCRRAC